MDFTEQDLVCRLCLNKLTGNYEPIEEVAQHTLNFLTLCPNLAVSDDPLMCEACALNLKKCFDFKARCLSTEDCIASFAEGEDKKVDLRNIYSKTKLDGTVDRVPDGHIICRFCLELVKEGASMSIRHDADLVAILQKYFLEMDLRIADDIIACIPCYNSLQFHVSFINNHLNVEGQINEYGKVEGTNYKGLVDLRDVATFISKSRLDVENISSPIIKEEKQENIVDTNVDVKVKFEDPTDVEQEEEKLVDKEIGQSNINSFQHHPSPSQSDCVPPQLTRAKLVEYTDEICGYQNNRTSRQQHLLSHRKSPDVVTPCTTYKCDLCNYETKEKSKLKRHMLTHKTNSEISMYKCESCTFETKYKNNLQKHKLTHMDVLEVEIHKCEVCLYETKWKTNLRKHLRTHTNTPDVVKPVTKYKCELCDYEAKEKSTLKMHMLIHKTRSEITMYKCELCDYEGKRKSHVKEHMLIHKTRSEIIMYKCYLCEYEAKRKSQLKGHMLTHKTRWEITMHKCDLCDYEAKQKSHVKKHMLIHKTPSEITMYKCDLCDYETKRKGDLKRHRLTHKTPAKITNDECEPCEIKHENCL